MNNKIKKIINNKFFLNSIFYTIGSLITPAIGIILLPFYTNNLEPSEYGALVTIQTLVGILQLFFSLSLHGAVTRFYYDYYKDSKKIREYMGTIYIFVFLLSLVSSMILIFLSNIIGSVIFTSISIYPYYYYLVGLSFFSALLSLPLALIRAQEKAYLYVLINFIKSLFIMGTTIYLIASADMGIEGALVSQLAITATTVFIVYISQLKYLKLAFNLNYLIDSLYFSLPLLPHVASSWIISSSDRIILEKYVSIAEVGIYSTAAQIAMVLGLFYSSVYKALVPRYSKLRMDGMDDSAHKLLNVFKIMIIVFGLIAIPIALFATKFLTNEVYHDALGLIPFLLIGQIIYGYYYVFVAKLFYYKKSMNIASSSIIAAVSNIVINFILIPFIGIYGAVVSTLISELLRVLIIYRWSNIYN